MIPDSSRQLLINAGLKCFASKGFEGSTVKEIADVAGVNASLINYHFSGKDGLFTACIQSAGQANLLMAQRILTPAQNRSELKLKLEIFVTEMLTFFAENPEVTQIIHREMENNTEVMKEICETTFTATFVTINTFLASGIETHLLRNDLNPSLVSTMLVGAISQFGRHFSGGCTLFIDGSIQEKTFRDQLTHTITSVFLSGTLSTTTEKEGTL